MKKLLTGFMALALTAGLAAPAHADKDGIGLVLGALGGGVVGHQFGQGKGNTWATAIGAVTGAVVGQSVGQSLDRADRAYYSDASYGRGGRGHGWGHQPRYGYSSYTTYYQPAPVYYVPSYEQRVRTYEVRTAAPAQIVDNSMDRYCREYQSAVTVGGRTQGSYGTACLQPDGDWEVVR